MLPGAGMNRQMPATRSTVPPVAWSRTMVSGSPFGSLTQSEIGMS